MRFLPNKSQLDYDMGSAGAGLLAVCRFPTFRNMLSDISTRLILGCKADLLGHFDALAAKTELPTLDELLKHASLLRERYASQAAYKQSLDKAEQDDAEPHTKFPVGSTWT
jgi:hypothetical protein